MTSRHATGASVAVDDPGAGTQPKLRPATKTRPNSARRSDFMLAVIAMYLGRCVEFARRWQQVNAGVKACLRLPERENAMMLRLVRATRVGRGSRLCGACESSFSVAATSLNQLARPLGVVVGEEHSDLVFGKDRNQLPRTTRERESGGSVGVVDNAEKR